MVKYVFYAGYKTLATFSMKNLNFLIDWYHKENERRDSINRALNIPIGILTGLFILFFFLLREFRYEQESISILIIIFLFYYL